MHPPTPRPARRHRAAARIAALALAVMTLLSLAPTAAVARADETIRVRRDGRFLVLVGRSFPEREVGRVKLVTRQGHRKIKKIRTNRNGRWSTEFFIGPRRRGILRIRAIVDGERETIRVRGALRTTEGRKKPGTTSPTPTEPTPTEPAPPLPSLVAGLSGPVGPDQTSAPVGEVTVAVGQLNQNLLNSKPTGTRFVLAPGVHRLTGPVYPRTDQQLLGMPGAVLSGSKVLSSWRQDGSWWVADGQTQRLPNGGGASTYCKTGWETCILSEDVFFDNDVLRQVGSLADLAPGRFFFDYTNSRIYLADDPSGHTVETTVAESALGGGAGSNVTISNLVIEKFGNPAQTGAIRSGIGWKVLRNTVRFNHGQGLVGNSNAVLRGNRVVFNGQAGMGGTGVNMLVENNEIAHSNTMGFSSGWSPAAAKFYKTDGLVLRNNWVHHNASHGLWIDINNIRTLYEHNLMELNGKAGIFHEISYDAVIRHNVIRGSYTNADKNSWADGAGIKIEASPNVEVYGNVLYDNPKGIILVQVPRSETAMYGAHELRNISVHDNDVAMTSPYMGLMTWNLSDPSSYYDSRSIRFTNNTYRLSGTAATSGFAWKGSTGATISPSQWKSFGHDVTGTFIYQ